MIDIYDFNNIFVKPTTWYLFIISGLNPFTVPQSHHLIVSLYSNNIKAIKNAYKLMVIAKTYRFNLLSEVVIIYIKALNRLQKEAIAFIYALIKLSNLFKVQKALKRDNMFKKFSIKYI